MRRAALAMALVAALGTGGAWAQSITGGLGGKEPAGAGITVEVDNPATGYHKELVTDADGRYGVAGLNPGNYVVTVRQGDAVLGTRKVAVSANVQAQVRPLSRAQAGSGVAATELGAVRVSAVGAQDVNPIDVSTTELSKSFDIQLINQLPVGRSVESVANLDSAVHYDNQTTGLVQMGGASPAENRYYYNEFDTTYDYTGIGATNLPFEALSNVQTLDSNAGVSWTSNTGGVISSTVRQGSNRFKAGYSLYFTPGTSWFQPHQEDSFDGLGNYYHYSSANSVDPKAQQYLWASGALVKDRLFFFAMLGNVPAHEYTGYTSNRQYDYSARDKNALLNLTWNISANQSLNVVGYREWSQTFSNQYALTQAYTPSSVGGYTGWSDSQAKNQFLIGNYHWQINDTMSLRLMGGYLSSTTFAPTSSSGTGLPYVTEHDANGQVTNIGPSNTSTQAFPVDYWRKGFKGDFTWRLGDHTVTLGAERYRHYINNLDTTTEGGVWTYYTQPGAQLPNGAVVPGDGRYVQLNYKTAGGAFYTVNKAAYIDDTWQVTDRWLAYAGLRDDYFINKNVNGQNFFRRPILSPRFGVAWDVDGDGTTKLGANAGKYTIPIPSAVNNGAAGAALTWNEYYTYTGRDPSTQAPTGLTQIGPRDTLVNGLAPASYNVATSNLKAPYQYEFEVYLQHVFANGWSSKVDAGYATLKRTIDDACPTDAITAYAQSHGYPDYVDQTGCPEVNPGIAQVFTRDYDGDGQLESLTLPGDLIGPPPKRKYTHVTFELEHPNTPDEPYFLDLSYTWAHLYGNYDGMIQLNQRVQSGPEEQAYWDFPGVMDYSSGNLSSDVRHSVKLNGIYYFPGGFRLGSTLFLSTGTALSCFGTYPDPDNPARDYGPSTHYCDGKPAPQGGQGHLPFFLNLSVSAGYDWQINPRNALSVDLQIQNITNRHGRIDSDQTYDQGLLADGSSIPNPAYGAGTWQTPRTTMLIVRYSFQ